MRLLPILRAIVVAGLWRLAGLTATAACIVLPPDAVAWWKADHSTAELVSSLPGTLLGDATLVDSPFWGALSVDGGGDLLSVPNSTSLQLQSFTLEAWIQRASTTASSKDSPPTGAIFAGGTGAYGMALGGDGVLVMTHVGIGAVAANRAITDLEWHHVAITKDGTLVSFYIDGTAAGVATYSRTFTFNAPFGIGALGEAYLGRWYGYWGQIDEMTIYSRPLRSEEIQSVFAAGSDGKCAADLSLQVTSAPSEATVGEPFNVGLVVRNLNSVPVPGVIVSNVFCAQMTSVSGVASQGGCSLVDGALVCDLGTVSAGEGVTITLQLTPTASGNCQIRSGLRAVAGNGNPANDAVEATVEVLGGCTESPSGLVAWWQGENNGQDLVGSNDGAFTGGTPEFTPGRIGQAFSFDGRSGYRVASAPNLQLQEFTIETWVKRASLTASSLSSPPVGVIFGGSSGAYGLTIGADGALILSHLGVATVNGSRKITDLNWHHVALTRSGSAVRFFLDAQDAGAATYSGTFTFNGPFGIGAAGQFFGSANYAFLGAIDELSLYSRALAPTEIKAIQFARSAGKCFEDVSLAVSGPRQTPEGETATYTLSVENHGRLPATAVVVTNPIPAGATFVSADPNSGTTSLVGGVLRWEVGAVAGGTTATLTVKVNIAEQGTVRFVAGVSRGEADLSLENNVTQFDIEIVGPCAPLPAGLITWLAAEGNTSGLGGRNGTIVGAVGYSEGRTGQAFSFDGAGAVDIASDPIFQSQAFSVEGWVYPTRLDGREDLIVTHESVSAQSARFLFAIRGQSRPTLGTIPYANIAFYVGVAANAPSDDSGWIDGHAQVPVGQWSHVALTYGEGTANVYVNGVLTRSVTGLTGPLAVVDGPIRLGSRRPAFLSPAGEDRFNGRIDEFTYYGRVLLPSEVADINLAGSAGKCRELTPVKIVSPPADQSAFIGDSISFTVGASGSPPFSYQWQSNDLEIIGETAATLSLTAVTRAAAGRYSVTVCNLLGCAPEVAATLTVHQPPAVLQIPPRDLRSPGVVTVPIQLMGNGDENAISFSLEFDPSLVSFVGATQGDSAPGAQLLVNTTLLPQGRVGLALALPAGSALPKGLSEVMRVEFRATLSEADYSVPLLLVDSPIPKRLADANAHLLPATWGEGGLIHVIAFDFEADVAPRPNGDNSVDVSDWVQVGRFVAALDEPATGGEFRRADCAPRVTSGNGVMSVSDWVQAGRFAAGLDAVSPGGGPSDPLAGLKPAGRPMPQAPGARKVHLSGATWYSGQTNDVLVVLEASGDENALAFSLSFDPAVVAFVEAVAAEGAGDAAFNLNTRNLAQGRLGLALALNAGVRFEAGAHPVAKLQFRARPSETGTTPLNFADSPVLREIASPLAVTLPSDWQDIAISVVFPALSVRQKQTPEGIQIVLAWPANLADVVLESTEDLDRGTWNSVPVTPVLQDGFQTVPLPADSDSAFFRLRLP